MKNGLYRKLSVKPEGNVSDRFFLLDEKGNSIVGFGDYPYRDEKEKRVSGIIRGEIYQGRLASNNRGTRFVQAVLKSKIMVFYEKEKEGWKCIKENLESFPACNYNSPAMDAETPLGYLDVCATDSHVYALYSGRITGMTEMPLSSGKRWKCTDGTAHW